ncbi:ATP-dependent DNA helicase [Trichonephila clavipes]|uniref:ATP-dependent DNA helicase n=1 Tax=Trichonephila clavipes TaxID=2585209 RepID=A0A8X6VNV5_TRICX|nr:ATP-dependent DNA helicase [Trichonephila clavipes]
MGGILVLLAGDFRQTPSNPEGTLADEISACIKSSSFWAEVEKFSLKMNMRVHLHNDVDSEHYAETQLKIGDGCLDADAGDCILLFREFFNLVENDVDLIAQIYLGLPQNFNRNQWLCARSILVLNNDIVNKIYPDNLNDVRGNEGIFINEYNHVRIEKKVLHLPQSF